MKRNRFGMALLLSALAAAGCGKEGNTGEADKMAPSTQTTSGTPGSAGTTSNTNSAPSATTTTTTPGTSSIPLATLDAVTTASKPYKLALIVKTRNNSFFTPMISAFETTAKSLGAAPLVQSPAQEGDKEKQIALIQDMVAQKVDAILITPADSQLVVPALKDAQAKGIVVVNLDNRIDANAAKTQGLNINGYVGADNEAGGKLAGEAMVKALNGTGNVGILEGIPDADNGKARKRGFESAVNGKLTIVASEVANWDRDQAYKKTQNMLAAHPDIVGLFACNDKMAVGAMKAIAEAGKKGKITVIGFDNIPDIKGALASGEMNASIEQHPDFMGKYGTLMAVGLLDKKVQAGGEVLVTLEVAGKK